MNTGFKEINYRMDCMTSYGICHHKQSHHFESKKQPELKSLTQSSKGLIGSVRVFHTQGIKGSNFR